MEHSFVLLIATSLCCVSCLFPFTAGESFSAAQFQPPAFPDLKLFINDDGLLASLLNEYTQPDNCLVDPALLGPVSTLTSPSLSSSLSPTPLPSNDCSALWTTALPARVTAKTSLASSSGSTSSDDSKVTSLPTSYLSSASDSLLSISVTSYEFVTNVTATRGGGIGVSTTLSPSTDVATLPGIKSEQGSKSDNRNVIIIAVACVVGGLLVLIVAAVLLVKCLPRIKQRYYISKKRKHSARVERQVTQVSTISCQSDDGQPPNGHALRDGSTNNNNGIGQDRHANRVSVGYARQESTDTQHTVVSQSSPDDASSTGTGSTVQHTPPTQSSTRRMRPVSINSENSSGGSPTTATDKSSLFNFMRKKPVGVKNDVEVKGDIRKHPNGGVMLTDLVPAKQHVINEEKTKVKATKQKQQSADEVNTVFASAPSEETTESPASSAKSLESASTSNTLGTTESLVIVPEAVVAVATETAPQQQHSPTSSSSLDHCRPDTNATASRNTAAVATTIQLLADTPETPKKIDTSRIQSLQSTPLSTMRSISETSPQTDERLASEQNNKRANNGNGNGRFRPYGGGKNRTRMRSDIGGRKLDRVETFGGSKMPAVSPRPAGIMRQSSLHAVPVNRDNSTVNPSSTSSFDQAVVTTLPRKHTHAELVTSEQVPRVRRPRSISSSAGLSEELMHQHSTIGFLPVTALGNGNASHSSHFVNDVHGVHQSPRSSNAMSPNRRSSNHHASFEGPASHNSSFSSAPPTPNGTLEKATTSQVSYSPQGRIGQQQSIARKILRSQSVQQTSASIPYTSTPLKSVQHDSDTSSYAILSTSHQSPSRGGQTPLAGDGNTPWTHVHYSTPTAAHHQHRNGYARSMSSTADVSPVHGKLNGHSPRQANSNIAMIAGRPPVGANRSSSVQRRLFADNGEPTAKNDNGVIPLDNRRKSTATENGRLRKQSSTPSRGNLEVNVDEPMFDSNEFLWTNDVSSSPGYIGTRTFGDMLVRRESAASNSSTSRMPYQQQHDGSLRGWSTFPRGTHDTDASIDQQQAQSVSNRRSSLDNRVNVDPVYF